MTARVRQVDRVLQLLMEVGPAGLTHADAARSIGCTRLAARINDLEAKGCRIAHQKVRTRNRYGDATHIAVYTLEYVPSALVIDLKERVGA